MLGVIAGDEADWEPEEYGDMVCMDGIEEVENTEGDTVGVGIAVCDESGDLVEYWLAKCWLGSDAFVELKIGIS